METLINQINQEFEGGKGFENVDVLKLQTLMEGYHSDEKDWTKYAMFDPKKYTRNLVDAGNGNYNLIVLCWGPGQSSPIHDHANSHCIFKCLKGQLTEARYKFPESSKEMKCFSESTFHRNEVNYMSNKIGLHRVSNNADTPAVSLHLYSPPILECKTFCEDSGEGRSSGRICFYSKFGRKNSLTISSQCLLLPPSDCGKSASASGKSPSSNEQVPIPSPIPTSISNFRPRHSISNSIGTAESLYSFKMGSTDSISRKYSVSNNDGSSRKRSIDTCSEIPKKLAELDMGTKPSEIPAPIKKRSMFWS